MPLLSILNLICCWCSHLQLLPWQSQVQFLPKLMESVSWLWQMSESGVSRDLELHESRISCVFGLIDRVTKLSWCVVMIYTYTVSPLLCKGCNPCKSIVENNTPHLSHDSLFLATLKCALRVSPRLLYMFLVVSTL